MANAFYTPGEQRVERVKALFSRVASRYDLMNDLQSFGLHRYWKARLVKLAAPKLGSRALDVCCGTGDLSWVFARHGVRVIGLDFSQHMLDVGIKRKANAQSYTVINKGENALESPQPHNEPLHSANRVQFVRGDAVNLPFSEGTFDIVSVGYGLRNLADWAAGLEEMKRVAKRGGRVLVLDLGKPDNRVWRGLYFSYLRVLVPFLGWAVCGSASAYGYLLESLKHYPAQHGVAAKMHDLGFHNVRLINLLGGAMTINYGEN